MPRNAAAYSGTRAARQSDAAFFAAKARFELSSVSD
jgi:hypothetical protein